MIFKELPLQGAYEITSEPFSDDRGWFERVFCTKEFQAIAPETSFVQVNHSVNLKKGTLRGMHYQIPPKSEIKVIKCIRGSIQDVIVDLRKGSQTFLQWHSINLSAKNLKMIYIPKGFAHGFQTLKDNCELLYFHSAYYDKEYERGLNYNDPAIGINWSLPANNLSEKDASAAYIDKTFKGIEIK